MTFPRAKTAACALVAAFAFFRVSEGLRWSEFFHPDELVVAHWIAQTHLEGHVTDRAYPGGWFVLSRIWTGVESVAWNAARRWRAHSVQDGAVRAVDGASFVPPPDPGGFDPSGMQRGRDMNAVLFTLAAVFLFLAAAECGAGLPASVFAALLFASVPSALEHAHYCETDVGMLFSGCLAAWLAARAVRTRSAAWFFGASVATGFAVACKYSLVVLLPWPVVAAWFVSDRSPRRAAALALGGLAA
ncbi:MAG: glycosyltransferase family 39 protein, partial [Kiritimatiellae bacterium]|nr:glycosyltransferase family 39 protein [Kiritimatiellia bacterium]